MHKLFIYDNIDMPEHDNTIEYRNTIPFCIDGIKKHFSLTKIPEEADFFYMGQFAEGKLRKFDNYDFIDKYPDKHICDIEGDWLNTSLPPEYLPKCIFTINGLKKEYKSNLRRMFIRPTFSKNLIKLLSKTSNTDINYNRIFTFIGFNDPFNIRRSIKNFFDEKYKDSANITITDQWLGSSNLETKHDMFNNTILSGTFSLCPRGSGVDSVRFLESCFHARIPIVISDNICFGHNFPDKFYFQYNFDRDFEDFIREIMNISDDIIREYSNNARTFFDTYVRKYFQDPTLFFLNWYKELNYGI